MYTTKKNYIGIAFIHDLELTYDARAQKEVSSLINAGYHLMICDWNKKLDGKNQEEICQIRKLNLKANHIQVKVKKRAGFKDNIWNLIKFEIRLFKWLQKNRSSYSCIHACNMDTAYIGMIISRMYHKKLVYDIYDDFADCHKCGRKLYDFIKVIDSKIIKLSDAVIICSERRKEQLAAIPDKLYVIHNTPDIEDIDSSLMSVNRNEKMKIAYIGNLTKGRMLEEVIDIVSRHQQWELYCGGSGDLEAEIEQKAKQNDNIYFLGRLPYEKVLALEANCDVIPALYDPEFPNHIYAAPNKFYESLYLGKPTIMAHNTGMDWFVDKYHTGITVDFNINSVENAFALISEELEKWREAKEEIKKLYIDNFDWKLMRKKLISMYEDLMK